MGNLLLCPNKTSGKSVFYKIRRKGRALVRPPPKTYVFTQGYGCKNHVI